MTDMSTHMEHDQSNLLADLGQMPAVDVTAKGRSLGIGFYLAVAFIVVIVLAAILAPWLPLKDPEQSYVVRRRAAAVLALVGVLVRHRSAVARHVQPHDLGRPHLAHGRVRGDRVRHARRRLARHDRRLLPGPVQRGDLVLLRDPAVVPRTGAGHPDHLAPRPQPVHDRFTSASWRSLRSASCRGPTTVSFADREFVLAAAHARRQAPAHHRARAAPQRRHPDERVRVARRGRRHRRRGWSGLPRAVGPRGHHVGQADPERRRSQRPGGRPVDRLRADHRPVPHRAVAQLRGDRLRSHFDVKESAL